MATVTSDKYRPERSANLATFPGPVNVPMFASTTAYVGQMLVSVGGYGKHPDAANAMTGTMRGVVVDGAIESTGVNGGATAVCKPGVYRFKNHGTNPAAATNVPCVVYASDGETVSIDSADGPPAGTLIGFDANDPQGCPCEVVLKCFL